MSSAISIKRAYHQRLVQMGATSTHSMPPANLPPNTKQLCHANGSRTDRKARQPPAIFTWKLLSIPAFITAAYAFNFLVDCVRLGDPVIVERIRASVFGIAHILGGLIAMILGPFQFLSSLRKRNSKAHRIIGRVYMAGILMGGVCAFHVSFASMCRPVGQYAFAFLGLIWLGTGIQGMLKIWAGDVARHRDWMTRNFSLTYAAVMLRWQLPIFIFMGMETEPALTLTGFTSWLPNLLFAEWWIKQQYRSIPHV